MWSSSDAFHHHHHHSHKNNNSNNRYHHHHLWLDHTWLVPSSWRVSWSFHLNCGHPMVWFIIGLFLQNPSSYCWTWNVHFDLHTAVKWKVMVTQFWTIWCSYLQTFVAWNLQFTLSSKWNITWNVGLVKKCK